MIAAVAVIVAFACVAASARRMWLAASPTALHPEDVVAALGPSPDPSAIARLRRRLDATADWERDLLDALSEPREEARAALVNEQLTELDLRVQRWARVPRVCASIATSFGLLLGTLVLRRGLRLSADFGGELGERIIHEVLGDALSVVALGIVGTTFCVAAHGQARTLARERLRAVDRMIDALEKAASRPLK